jgi:2-polyprenyl-6-methoxyphenol hydroxylase-like FAD-dependent oxidoreductase
VRFRSGKTGIYDLVIGADGAHSRIRALRFGPEERFRHPLGLAHAWFTLEEAPSTPTLDGWALVHNAPGRLGVSARPGHRGQQEVGLTFGADELPPRDDEEARFALLDRTFSGVGWRAAEFVEAARRAPDFALDTYDQIRMPTWVNGRVVLIGDAAWCASPLSGLGTALGLRGAATLAEALSVGDDLGDDLSRLKLLAEFESAMRPRVIAAQKLIPGRVDMVAPRGRIGIVLNALAMRVIQWRLLEPLVGRVAGERGHSGEPVREPRTQLTR